MPVRRVGAAARFILGSRCAGSKGLPASLLCPYFASDLLLEPSDEGGALGVVNPA